ncbi:GDP-L-fucose synthase family protein [Autumnicola psychrophila]|uniref:GDP-L-fucose synthase n=1 Tax=Autumnicola psychrophila TaxID=3075592 RepID=A0ABU3DQS4_9FLAO|nr:GDP-L-fucose synthase [Zunongwangia sp. F225]MDT0686064.1 GDP-L-fucose synthase [Zunongwangia sp. F225]
MQKESKIFIAGHQGLVGSAIKRNLEKRGHTNIITRTREELDLTEADAVNAFFSNEKPTYVFLAAAKVGGIVANNKYRADFIYENLMIQNQVIHQSYIHNVKKLLFLGSTCIYPKDCPQPMIEENLLTGPLEFTNEPYAIAKIAGLKMCESYNIQYGTNFISVMPTNLYGPNDNFNLETSHVLPALIRKIHLGKALQEENWEVIREDLDQRPLETISGQSTQEEIYTVLRKYGVYREPSAGSQNVRVKIWGTGNAMREFLWSEDMAEACVFIMKNVNFQDVISIARKSGSSTFDEPLRNTHLNIGTGKDISIKELAYLVKNTLAAEIDLLFDVKKPDGTMKKLTDPAKLHQLGWKHKIELEEGVKKLYKWYLMPDVL